MATNFATGKISSSAALASAVTYVHVSSLGCKYSFLGLQAFSTLWQSVDFVNILSGPIPVRDGPLFCGRQPIISAPLMSSLKAQPSALAAFWQSSMRLRKISKYSSTAHCSVSMRKERVMVFSSRLR